MSHWKKITSDRETLNIVTEWEIPLGIPLHAKPLTTNENEKRKTVSRERG